MSKEKRWLVFGIPGGGNLTVYENWNIIHIRSIIENQGLVAAVEKLIERRIAFKCEF